MEVHERMRAEWNERAREDAHYFVAFGRRDQDDEEFFATASGLVGELENELKRFTGRERALEIGCGPGRLLRPMSRHFKEIHGVDVSDEMVKRAQERFRGIPNIHPHHANGSDLRMFPDAHFDFVYSYAVFQHIPSHDVVFSYLRETIRVLKPGGVARLQINGLPKTSKAYTTWEGVRIGADEIRELNREHGIRLLSLTGVETQYMWTTWQKPEACSIRSICNAFSSEQAVPQNGRLACAALTIEGLPAACDLNSLQVLIDGAAGTVCYVGPCGNNNLTQVNVFLPPNPRTGLLPVRVEWNGQLLCDGRSVRVIPPGPSVPRLTAVSDAVNLMSPQRIESGLVKATLEEVDRIETFAASVDGIPVHNVETFRTDPLCERWEVNFAVPPKMPAGGHVLEVHLGKRLLTRMGIILSLLFCAVTLHAATEADLRKALSVKTGKTALPAGVIEVAREITLPADVHDLEIVGSQTTLRAAGTFRGRALLILSGGKNIRIHDLSLDGDRDEVGRLMAPPPATAMMSRFIANNGILAENVTGLEIADVKALHIAGFTLLLNASHKVTVRDIEINESGGYNLQRTNSGTGGILLEEGTTDFTVTRCLFGKIRGSGIVTRSIEHSPANTRGRIAQNEFAVVARDAIQLANSTDIAVEDNRGKLIGYPQPETDITGGILPSAVHATGGVTRATIGSNLFDNIDGRCFTLSGLADSTVKGNTCTEELFGAVILSGANNKIIGNRLLKLNLAHKDSPETLSSGIYLEKGAKNNEVADNEIAGYGMSRHCVVAAEPGNKTAKNDCSDEAAVALLLRATPH